MNNLASAIKTGANKLRHVPEPVPSKMPCGEIDKGDSREDNIKAASSPSLEELRTYLTSRGIKTVVFDMDLTVTALHSGGFFPADDLDIRHYYIESAMETDALAIMKLCTDLGIRMGIATFQQEVNDNITIGGSVLVRQVLERLGTAKLIDERSVATLSKAEYANMVANQGTYDKNDMIRRLFANWDEDFVPSSTVLIDDTNRNVMAFCRIGGHGISVHGHGLRLEDVTYHVPEP